MSREDCLSRCYSHSTCVLDPLGLLLSVQSIGGFKQLEFHLIKMRIYRTGILPELRGILSAVAPKLLLPNLAK